SLTPLRDPLELASPMPNDIEAWVAAAEQSSFQIVAARENYEVFREQVAVQRAAHLPTLDLSGSFSRNDSPTNATPPIVGPVVNTSSIGLTLSVPIYSGGIIQSRVREALANRERAEQ